MIVEDNWIAISPTLAGAAESIPNGRDAIRAQDRVAGGFVKYLVTFIDDLDVLSFSHGAVGVGRRAIATDAWERNAVEVEEGGGYIRRRSVKR